MVYDIQDAGFGFGWPIEDTEELQSRGDGMIDTLLYDFQIGRDTLSMHGLGLAESLFDGELTRYRRRWTTKSS